MLMFPKAAAPAALCLLAASALTTQAVVAAEVVNSYFSAPALSGQSYLPGPIACGTAGFFSFTAKFCNRADSSGELYDLESQTVTLTNGNQLIVGATCAGGAGSVLPFPTTGGYADNRLSPGECVDVVYSLGMASSARFRFFVDIVSNPPPNVAYVPVPQSGYGTSVSVCGGTASLRAANFGLWTASYYAYQVELSGNVRVDGLDPAPEGGYTSFSGTGIPPVGCGTGRGNAVFALFSASAMKSIRVPYRCDCP
jgi:hypothetical protein